VSSSNATSGSESLIDLQSGAQYVQVADEIQDEINDDGTFIVD
jgi:hypothetical protein